MSECEVCGNAYDKPLEIKVNGSRTRYFDCFECAIHAMAPQCAHCGCKVVGHGAESDGVIYCCAHCAKQVGVKGLDDRA